MTVRKLSLHFLCLTLAISATCLVYIGCACPKHADIVCCLTTNPPAPVTLDLTPVVDRLEQSTDRIVSNLAELRLKQPVTLDTTGLVSQLKDLTAQLSTNRFQLTFSNPPAVDSTSLATELSKLTTQVSSNLFELRSGKRAPIKTAVYTIFGALFAVHCAYAARRFNLIKSLQIDMVHRIADGITVYNRLAAWRLQLKAMPSRPSTPLKLPLLKPFPEQHVLYKSVQSETIHCLWGMEIQRVRETYRHLDELEERLQKIQTRYDHFIKTTTDTFQIPPGTNAGLTFLWGYAQSEIENHINKYTRGLVTLLILPTKRRFPTLHVMSRPPTDADNFLIELYNRICRTPNDSQMEKSLTTWNPLRRPKVGNPSDWHGGNESDCENLKALVSKRFIPKVPAYATQVLGPLALEILGIYCFVYLDTVPKWWPAWFIGVGIWLWLFIGINLWRVQLRVE